MLVSVFPCQACEQLPACCRRSKASYARVGTSMLGGSSAAIAVVGSVGHRDEAGALRHVQATARGQGPRVRDVRIYVALWLSRAIIIVRGWCRETDCKVDIP